MVNSSIGTQSNSPHLPMEILKVYVDKIKKMILKYANTQAFSGSQDNYMASKFYKFSNYKHGGLLKTWNPVQPTKPSPI